GLGAAEGGITATPGVLAVPTSGQLSVTDLRTNNLHSPLGIDTAAPALSWTITSDGYNQKQTAYRIEAAASASDLAAETPLLWDSGRTASDRNAGIAYGGPPLASRQRVYWRVQVWNGQIASAWSAPDFWETGLLSASDWSAQWIKRGASATSEASAPMFAAHFQVDPAKNVARARLYISGLGLYYAEVNGNAVADSYFDPSESDFRRRIFYSTYDVTNLLRPGANGLGFQLGNGMYGNGVSPNGGRYEKSDGLAFAAAGLHGTAKGIAQLEITYADGSTARVATSQSWQYIDSPITFNTWYGGEDYDARRAAQLAGWSTAANPFAGWINAAPVPTGELPAGALRARPTPPIRIVQTLSGTTISQGQFPSGDGWVDVSQNGAGFEGIRFTTSLGLSPDYAGVSLQFYPAEIKTGTDVDQSSSKAGAAPMFDTYTFSGREAAGTIWNPRFVYHGFRYYKVVITLPAGRSPTDYGFANQAAMLGDLMNNKLAFLGHIVRTDNATTGSFTSSNRSLNLIHTIIDRSIASQMYSEFTDCPHIEKLGWIETSHLMFPSIADTYDIRAWMSKIAQDTVDSQVTGATDQATQNNGSLGTPGYATAIAPPFQLINGLSMDPDWNGAIIFTPWEDYQAYGDPSVLRSSYPAMQRYLKWLEARYTPTNTIIGDAQMGDWGQYQVSTPSALVVTAAFYRMADVTAQTAAILGDSANATAYANLAAMIKANFNAKFFNPATSTYGTGTQASNAIPLFAGLVPSASANNVVGALTTVTQNLKYTITTGEIALRQMVSALTAYGRSDVLYKMALQPNQPGYRYIAETLGETTMIEYWNYKDQWGNMRSRNHAMMGHIQDWFTRGLAGIDRASPGYRDIVIKPYLPDNTAEPADSRTVSVAATIGSAFGSIGSGWQIANDGSLTMSVTIPVGATASVFVPALGNMQNTVFVSYGSVSDQTITGTLANGYVEIAAVPSGQYTFKRSAQ
ncbi:MAG: glycoside hydrolase family 78 protein, partial [Myxococcota bacterium]|nr:glycoside hydrolase family 78 protein [Myxococcota bacterium]